MSPSSLPSNLESTLERIHALISAVKSPMLDDWDPLELGLLLARLEYEGLDLDAQKKQFWTQAEPHLKEFPANSDQLWDRVNYVIQVFTEKLGFQGDTTNYYNIKNSFMNDVFLRRKGIPITLSLVFMALCRRAGLKAVGIAFPGHFLVRVVDGNEAESSAPTDWKHHRYVDCFDGCKVLTVKDCEERLEQWTRGVLKFGPDALKVAHPAEIVSRSLRNLKAIFAEKEDLARMYWVLSALIELCPNERVEAYKERGLLMGRMGRYAQATSDLSKYLSCCQDPAKAAHAERLMRFFEGQQDFTN
jgi:regulator of sirC expression with transglutaminase-like and TPR domain